MAFVHPTKKPIILDRNLDTLGNQWFSEVVSLISVPPDQVLIKVAYIKIKDEDNVELKWPQPDEANILTLEERQKGTFPNNLDSILDYTCPVVMDVRIAMSVLECLRRNTECKTAYMVVPEDLKSQMTQVYFKL